MTRWRYAPPAKYAPERDPAWRSAGREIARVSRLLGREPLPWQQQVWDVGTEYQIIGPGESEGDRHLGMRRYHYDTVLVTVPRQSGKTAGMAPVRLHRMMQLAKQDPGVARSLFSTAQTGKDAGKRMRDLIELVSKSPLAALFKSHYSTGSEGLSLHTTGTRLARFAPVIGAIHGETPHMVDLDEIWKLDDAVGRDIFEGAIEPAQITLHGLAQTWLFSTMGTEQSVFMNRLVKQGRQGRRPGLAFFEWSMPDGLDPYEPQTWWTFHPALGNTISVDALASRMPGAETDTADEDDEDEDAPVRSHAEWMRAYMNRLTAAADPLLTEEQLEDLVTDPAGGAPDTSRLAIAYEVAPEGACATVLAAWRDDDGVPCLRTIHTAPGTQWLQPFLRTLHAEWQPAVLIADDGGPTRRHTDALTAEPAEPGDPDPLPVVKLDYRSFITSCDQLLNLARDRGVRLDGSRTLRDGFLRLEVRTSNGLARFDRDRSPGPVVGPIAGAVALWGMDHGAEATMPLQIF